MILSCWGDDFVPRWTADDLTMDYGAFGVAVVSRGSGSVRHKNAIDDRFLDGGWWNKEGMEM